jgi:hypothetical protein
MTVLRKLWWGEYSLPVAFWLFYCLGVFVFLIVGAIILFKSRTIDARPIALIVCIALIWGYQLTASVGVWRSAAPYWTSPILMQRAWAMAARIVVAGLMARIVLGLIDGGAVALMQQMTGHIEF